MTDLAQGNETASRLDAKGAPLHVRLSDVPIALVTFAASLAVLSYGMSAHASFPTFLLLHLAVLAVLGWILAIRVKRNNDLTVAMLLLIATAAAGPIGALGCAAMAFSLWYRQPTPWRLSHWYDHISGVVARRPVAHLYDELLSGRLPSDPAATVPHFNSILRDTSLEDQQRVLGVIGRRYHADFRPVLRKALRHKNGFIRAQAAAIASRLTAEEKARLWSTAEMPATAPGSDAVALDAETPRP